MKVERKYFYEVIICYSKENYNGIEKDKPFVLALDNRSNNAYIFTNNKSNSRIVTPLEHVEKMLKNMFITLNKYVTDSHEHWVKFQENALSNVKILLVVTNEIHEDEKALVDALSGHCIMQGDYYHDKINFKIEGYIMALEDCGYHVTKVESTISPDEKEFHKLNFGL